MRPESRLADSCLGSPAGSQGVQGAGGAPADEVPGGPRPAAARHEGGVRVQPHLAAVVGHRLQHAAHRLHGTVPRSAAAPRGAPGFPRVPVSGGPC